MNTGILLLILIGAGFGFLVYVFTLGRVKRREALRQAEELQKKLADDDD